MAAVSPTLPQLTSFRASSSSAKQLVRCRLRVACCQGGGNGRPGVEFFRAAENNGGSSPSFVEKELAMKRPPPDPKIALTEKGHVEAEVCGKRIRELIDKDGVVDWQIYFYVSPYRRTLETLRGLAKAFEKPRIAGVREEPRLREQDFGERVQFFHLQVTA